MFNVFKDSNGINFDKINIAKNDFLEGKYLFTEISYIKESYSRHLTLNDFTESKDKHIEVYDFRSFSENIVVPKGCVAMYVKIESTIEQALTQNTGYIQKHNGESEVFNLKVIYNNDIINCKKVNILYKREIFYNILDILHVYSTNNFCGGTIVVYKDLTVHHFTYGSGMLYVGCKYGKLTKI